MLTLCSEIHHKRLTLCTMLSLVNLTTNSISKFIVSSFQKTGAQRLVFSFNNWIEFVGRTYCTVLYPYTIGWNDFALFLSLKPTWYCRSGIFYFLGVRFQKIGNFGLVRARTASSHIQKITGTLKIDIFFICRNLPYADASKNNCKNNNLIKNLYINFFIFQKWAKRLLICTVQGKIFFSYASKHDKEKFFYFRCNLKNVK